MFYDRPPDARSSKALHPHKGERSAIGGAEVECAGLVALDGQEVDGS